MSNIVEYCPYCLILSSNVQYCTVLFNITQVTISAYSYQSCDIERNIQILSKIVKYVLILSSIDEYCPVAPYLDIFQLKISLIHFDYESMQVCKYPSMQQKVNIRLSFSHKAVIPSLAITWKNIVISCKNLFLSLVVVRLVIFFLNWSITNQDTHIHGQFKKKNGIFL